MKGQLSGVVSRVEEISTTSENYEARLAAPERALSQETPLNRAVQLHIEDLEDRSR